MNCPPNITVSAESGVDYATNVTWTEPTSLDNSGMVGIMGSSSPGDTFSYGVTRVFYVAADGANNMAECAFDITVTGMNNAPTSCLHLNIN